MLIEYHGPKPAKTLTRFWGKEYRFAPVCEVEDEDGKVLLAECRDIFRLCDPREAQTAAGPVSEDRQPEETKPDSAPPVRKGNHRGRRAQRRQEHAES